MGLKSLKTNSDKYIESMQQGEKPIPFFQYADDPVVFFGKELNIELTQEQIVIAESVRDRTIANIEAIHGVVKSCITTLLDLRRFYDLILLKCLAGLASPGTV